VVSLAYAVLTVADSCLSQDDKPGEDMSPPFLLVREPDSTPTTSRVKNGRREFWLDWTDGCTRLRGPGSDGVQRGTPNASSFTQDGKGISPCPRSQQSSDEMGTPSMPDASSAMRTRYAFRYLLRNRCFLRSVWTPISAHNSSNWPKLDNSTRIGPLAKLQPSTHCGDTSGSSLRSLAAVARASAATHRERIDGGGDTSAGW